MDRMILTLTFYIDEPIPTQDIDDLTDLVSEAITEKVGDLDYLTQDISGIDYNFQID
jgi:hypothetical protein